MKKLVIAISLIFAAQVSFAQFKIGPAVGLPTGDAGDIYSLMAGADVLYLFGGNPDALLKFGAASGFYNYFGEDIDGFSVDDAQFIPIAGAARVIILDTIVAGADLGYGIGLGSESDGGFYWKLVAGIDLGNVMELTAFYHNLSQDGYSLAAIGAGLLFEFGGDK